MNKKAGKILLSVTLIAFSYGFIIYKLIKFEELKALRLSYISISESKFYMLFFVFILMFVNWSVEAIKWKLLIYRIHQISFGGALKAIFSGITLGIFTPNRIGEIGGRVLFIDKGKRTFGILATSLGSFAQFITTIINGLVGLELFLLIYPEKAEINPLFNKLTSVVILLILIALFIVYFRSILIKPVLMKFKFFKERENQLNYFSETNFKLLIKVLSLSIGRYIIFLSQFILLLIFFDVELNITQAYISISLIYLFSTLIPSSTLVELGIRGSLAIFFIGFFSNNLPGIILSSFALWIINLAIPSIIGSVFFIKNNV